MNLLICLITILLYFSPTFATQHRVIIDPGHGGEERGAVNGKYEEAELALQVSKRIYKLLLNDKDIEPTLTRNSDKTLSLAKRVSMAQKINADLFVSIHINSSPDKRARGGEVYIKNELSPHKEKEFLALFENGTATAPVQAQKSMFKLKSKQTEVIGILESINEAINLKLSSMLAEEILTTWGGHKRTYHNRIHQAPFYVVKHTKMPSVLVELGFISNTKEARKLTTKSYQNKLALGVYKGIKKYFNQLKIEHDKPMYSSLEK